MAPSMKRLNGCDRLKMERKTLEKKRRLHMKCLCLKLSSLIPNELKTSSKSSSLTQQDNLDLAATYIEKLRERVERLKEMKKVRTNNNDQEEIDGEEMPVIKVRLVDSNLEVVLIINKLNQRVSMFHEVISVLEEEGAETTNASFSIVSDKIFHTIHSKIMCSQIDFNASRILERLQEMVH